MTLRDRLVQRQRQLGLHDGEIAAILGVPRTSYNAIKNQRNGMSLYMVRKVVAAFPDLERVALRDEEDAERIEALG